jgi:murein DD-endopeptidase MepM/ murein hydrolase activator NlpD
VLAAGSGAVIAAKDGTPDHAPGKMPSNLSFAELPGNYIVIAMDGGVSAFYAHLKPGSLRVKVGDKVKAAQVIAAVGNNGGSLAPHLHFHIVNGRNGATSDGYPYVLKSFQLKATADPSVLMKSIEGEPAFSPRNQMKPVARKRQLPLNFNIVDFPGGG